MAQVAGGIVSGIVTGPDSKPLAFSEVAIRSLATGIVSKKVTDGTGAYSVANLMPGLYTASATAPGFSVGVHPGVTVSIGAQLQINFHLQHGDVSEKVVSTDFQPAVDLFSSSMGVVVAQTTVRQLPLNGRDWTSLAALRAGVSPARTQPVQAISNQRANRGLGEQLSISGARPQWNNYRVDGISIEDYSNGGPGSVLGNNFGVDAIQEFYVVTSNVGADYGRSAGGILNAAIRSGTSAFHASAYDFLRNSAFDARNYFDAAAKIPPFKQNQYGATGGGPIHRGSTFFFGNYEALNQNVGLPQVDVVPSANARKGQLVAGPVVVDPQVQPYLAFYPLPDVDTTSDTGVHTFNLQQLTTEQFVTARGDHRIGNRDTLSATYLFDKSQKTGPDPLNIKNISAISRRQVIGMNETHLFAANFLNSIRIGGSRVISISPTTVSAINPKASDPSLGFVPNLTVGLISVTGINPFPGGLGAVGEYDFHFNSLQAYDDVLWSRGKHQLKFGGNVEHILDNQLGKANPNGQYLFSSLTNFLTNKAQSFNAPLAGAIIPRDLRTSILGGYFQDDWHVLSNLSVNLGLRYEASSVPTETAGRLSALHNLTDLSPTLGAPYFNNPTLRNFEPRVGFSYDPTPLPV